MNANERLERALLELFAEGIELIKGPEGRRAGSSGEYGLARELLGTVAGTVAVETAFETAVRNGYAVNIGANGSPKTAGRRLDPSLLVDLGVISAILSGEDFDRRKASAQLANVLSGPPVSGVELIGLDAGVDLTSNLRVDGWELFNANEGELREYLPLSCLEKFQQHKAWDPQLWSGSCFLRRTTDTKPRTGLHLNFPSAQPEREFWRPLLLISLASPEIVHMWSHHVVEPGRRIDRILDHVYYEPYIDDEGEEVGEFVRPLSLTLRKEDADEFQRRLVRLEPLLPVQPLKARGKAGASYRRLQIASQRLLSAGENAMGTDPTPFDPIHISEALIHYVVALEALLGADTIEGELTRKIAQRAAVLAGRNDRERVFIAAELKRIYGIRSKILHGSLADAPDVKLSNLRKILRRAIIARLVHGDPVAWTPGQEAQGLAETCDEALLSSSTLGKLIAPLGSLNRL